jgi:ribose 5-phosphate isomerase A
MIELGCKPEPRQHNGQLFLTDNGNIILDCQIDPIARPAELEQQIRAIPGVVGTGLFLNMNPTVLIQRRDQVETRGRGVEGK